MKNADNGDKGDKDSKVGQVSEKNVYLVSRPPRKTEETVSIL